MSKVSSPRRPTLREVAVLAETTPATVSYVLSPTSTVRISQATRERVLQAAEKLGYRPHLAARALATGRTKTIGLCFGAEGVVPFADDYDREVLHGVLQAAAQASYALQVIDRPGGKIPHHVDGWIAVQTPPSFDLHRLGTANVVFLDPFDAIPKHQCLWADNRAAGRLLAEQLAPRISSVLVLLHGPLKEMPRSYRERFQAFQNCWKKLVPRGKMVQTILHPNCGASEAEDFLRRWQQPIWNEEITHLVCLSDMQATRVLQEFRKVGLHSPEHYSISGFDNTMHSRLAYPAISTVDMRVPELARNAVNHLLGQITNSPVTAPQPRPLWIERGSTWKSKRPTCA